MHKDNEVRGIGNSLDFGARIYDSRLGRFLSTDPLADQFPSWSPYAAFGNNPVRNIDPDGRSFIVSDKSQQQTVLGYMRQQFGADIFKFNKKGSMVVDRKAYRNVRGGFNANQNSMAEGVIQIVKSKRIIEAKIYDNTNINFTRNPTKTVKVEDYDSDLGRSITTYRKEPMYSGKGIVIPKLDQEAITLDITGDDRAFILFNSKAAETGTFKAKDGQTDPCPSCLFMHEALDHGLDYIKKGTTQGGQTSDNIEYHNKALENKGSSIRTGEDHK